MKTIDNYTASFSAEHTDVCETLRTIIDKHLTNATSKIWHSHPVWFINDNPIVGFSLQKPGIRLMFWSGMSFEEEKLKAGSGKFMDASIFYNTVEEILEADLKNWLKKAQEIQWDYKNIVKRKGKLERLV